VQNLWRRVLSPASVRPCNGSRRSRKGLRPPVAAFGSDALPEVPCVHSDDALHRAGPGHYIGSHMGAPVEGLADIAILMPDFDDD
jgi:hypothetical protein